MKIQKPIKFRYLCHNTREPLLHPCQDIKCDWWVKSEDHLNCTWVAVNSGPYTLEEIGMMMGITRERVRQIEAKALRKLRHPKRRNLLKDFADEEDIKP